MKIEGDEVIFSTGKNKYANCGIIGLTPKGHVTEGFDGGFYDSDFPHALWEEEPELTLAECVELADFMIERWMDVRLKYIEQQKMK